MRIFICGARLAVWRARGWNQNLVTAAHSSPLTVTSLAPGTVLGRYELLLPIAAGGMAMVWAARLTGSRGFQKVFAVKTMLPQMSEDDQFEQMFLDEASLASEIKHPHAVEILDLGEQEGVLFLVMEWIDGVPLNRIAKAAKAGGGVPRQIAVRIIMQAGAGLHAAHELRRNGELVGLVHRDVSPQNILVTGEGVTKVVDFGVAKATALGGGATVAGQVKGKISYMSPEQARGDAVDRRTDVFALGTVLYALTTGKHPFRRDNEGATMMAICSDEPVLPPSKLFPDFPAPLEAVLLKALEKDVSKRYATSNDFLRALDQLPAELRASSDEDVANYVKSLVGKELNDRREQLRAALERRAQGILPVDVPMPKPESRSRASVSSVASFSVVGTAASLRPGQTGAAGLSRNKTVAAVLGLAVIAVAGAVTAMMLRSTPAQQEISPVPPTTSPSLGAPGVASVPPTIPAPTDTAAIDLDQLPTEAGETGDLPAGPAAKAAPRSKRVSGPAVAVKPKETAAAAPKPAPAPAKTGKWKNDPGF
jgi:eukaryotic-like serine/threonine-protein kinase